MAGEPRQSSTQASEGITVANRLAVLASEHAALASTRAMIWGEIFSRAAMYLSTLSGAIVALALVGQRSGFDDTFLNFTLLVLPIVLFIGWTTLARFGTSNSIEATCVAGMNRIRGMYVRLIPDLEPIFVMSRHDDVPGVTATMGVSPGTGLITQLLSAIPVLITTINSAVLAAFVGAVAARFGASGTAVIALGLVAFLLSVAVSARAGRRRMVANMEALRPIYPTTLPGE